MSANITFLIKLLTITLLLGYSHFSQAFYPEGIPPSDDQIFTTNEKFKRFIVSSCYFSDDPAAPNKYIAKQRVILTPTLAQKIPTDTTGVLNYWPAGDVANYQSYLTASELQDVHFSSLSNSSSIYGFVVKIPFITFGNQEYEYTLTMPLVDTYTTTRLYIYGWGGTSHNIDLLKVAWNMVKSYKKVTFTFSQINGSTTTVKFTKTQVDTTTFNLTSANIVTLNNGFLEVHCRLARVVNDMKTSYYVLALCNIY